MEQELKDQINAWLQNPDRKHDAGVALLMASGKLRHLASMLLKKPNMEKLEYELAKLAPEAEVAEATLVMVPLPNDPAAQAAAVNGLEGMGKLVVVVGDDQDKMMADATQKHAQDTPDPLTEVTVKMSAVYTERAKLSNTLADQDSDEARKVIVDQIEELDEQYRKLEARKNYIEKNGHAPAPEQPSAPAPAADPTTPAGPDLDALKVARQKAAPNLSKAKAALAKNPEDVKLQEKVAKLSAEIAGYDHQIKVLKGA